MPKHPLRFLGTRALDVCCRRSVVPKAAIELETANHKPDFAANRVRPKSFHGRMGYEKLGLVVENLRIHCRPALPVVVRAGKTAPDIDGYCVRRGQRFVITINDRLNFEGVLNSVLHEWAHALAWNYSLERAFDDFEAGALDANGFEDICHGPEFGISFATVWRVFVKKILPALKSHNC
jgi:hypothetical protein